MPICDAGASAVRREAHTGLRVVRGRGRGSSDDAAKDSVMRGRVQLSHYESAHAGKTARARLRALLLAGTALASALTVMTSGPAVAQNWNGSQSTDWTDASNWDGGTVPTTGTVIINTTPPDAPVLGGGATGTSGGMRIGSSGGSGNLTIQDGSTLTSSGWLRIGDLSSGSIGVVTVTGAESKWTTTTPPSTPSASAI